MCTWLPGGIVMDAARPEVPPDFIFPPGEEAALRLSALKSLTNWRFASFSAMHIVSAALTLPSCVSHQTQRKPHMSYRMCFRTPWSLQGDKAVRINADVLHLLTCISPVPGTAKDSREERSR